MASVTGDVDIHATPKQILDVLADLPHYPEWSSVHKQATIETRDPAGRPARATMAVRAATGAPTAWTGHSSGPGSSATRWGAI
jgi:hypothetical protein